METNQIGQFELTLYMLRFMRDRDRGSEKEIEN